MDDATIYNPKESSVGGTHAFFLVRGDPKTYNLPPNPIVPTTLLKPAWNAVAIASAAMALGSLLAFALGGRK
jgi:formate dehydrogenase iron-sulfur subunit